uniref:(northern house mosquito) hypothetical protein n=1 Tax=Culex pipiens TaxID=7175 RepID=A0A8D8FXI3_CULPI
MGTFFKLSVQFGCLLLYALSVLPLPLPLLTFWTFSINLFSNLMEIDGHQRGTFWNHDVMPPRLKMLFGKLIKILLMGVTRAHTNTYEQRRNRDCVIYDWSHRKPHHGMN